jgi:hypothetical protein
MSRISRYQESISRFIKTKCSYADILKPNSQIESIININDHEQSIILLTILSGQYAKKKLKKPHGYYIASGVEMMMLLVMINDNLAYYESIYSKNIIKNFITQAPIYVPECLSQHMDTLESISDKDSVSRIQLSKLYKKIHTIMVKKLLNITKYEEFKGDEKIHRTDIIRYKFSDKNLIDNKYKKLHMIDKDKLIDYVERTYGAVCQFALICAWLLGFGDEKMINNLERLGIHLGMLIKLSHDFKNLERDLNIASHVSTNLIINYGIHECFRLFDDSKIKLLEGCLTLDIYNITIKEVIDHIEKIFDNHLKNADLELVSRYSSFSSI